MAGSAGSLCSEIQHPVVSANPVPLAGLFVATDRLSSSRVRSNVFCSSLRRSGCVAGAFHRRVRHFGPAILTPIASSRMAIIVTVNNSAEASRWLALSGPDRFRRSPENASHSMMQPQDHLHSVHLGGSEILGNRSAPCNQSDNLLDF